MGAKRLPRSEACKHDYGGWHKFCQEPWCHCWHHRDHKLAETKAILAEHCGMTEQGIAHALAEARRWGHWSDEAYVAVQANRRGKYKVLPWGTRFY